MWAGDEILRAFYSDDLDALNNSLLELKQGLPEGQLNTQVVGDRDILGMGRMIEVFESGALAGVRFHDLLHPHSPCVRTRLDSGGHLELALSGPQSNP